ncbi:MAG: DUF1343 domain-containing protein [Bacteroidetes bacterium]|nr:DUF1343 domain-containing protein [Bacteroidota bacterium]
MLLCLALCWGCQESTHSTGNGHTKHPTRAADSISAPVLPGAQVLLQERTGALRGKRVALVGNHTSQVQGVHLVDTLRSLGVEVVRVFAPEHGFRGEAEAGAPVYSGRDARTGIPVVSLYGAQKAPAARELSDVDLVIFDLQDVGCRFYTYISTLTLVMESCARRQIPLWVLDRPNPNGYYTEGPVLEPSQRSFVGMHPIPIVHGMTIGEYARMVNGEGWLPAGLRCPLEVIPCRGYVHSMHWTDTGLPWVPPSPNLPTVLSAELYPILCWYEGTAVSTGRGTEAPFMQLGMPEHMALKYRQQEETAAGEAPKPLHILGLEGLAVQFRPRSIPGKAEAPLRQGETCYGLRLIRLPQTPDSLWLAGLQLLDNFYREHAEYRRLKGGYGAFFNPFFDKLAGTPRLRGQIEAGISPHHIWQSWQTPLNAFRAVRKRYLIYAE